MKKNVLETIEPRIVLNIDSKFEPKEYFKNRKGLWISPAFNGRILEKAGSTPAGAEYVISSSKILKWANDKAIEKELPEKHLFTETGVTAIIANLIEKQPDRKEGALHTSYWNLFYTGAFVVSVSWGDGEWRVHAWHLVGNGWDVDSRVFFFAI